MIPKKVLIIDDDENFVDDAVGFFKGIGSECDVVTTEGRKGLERKLKDIEEGDNTELVLVDFQLGLDSFNGQEALHQIREKSPHLCVGLISEVDQGGFTARDADQASFYFHKDTYSSRDQYFEGTISKWNTFMQEQCAPRIADEWSPLKTVIVHTPGSEIQRVDVDDPRYLMEEPPGLEGAISEHKEFIRAIRRHSNSYVLDIRDLVEDVINESSDKELPDELASLLLDDRGYEIWRAFRRKELDSPSLESEAIEDLLNLGKRKIVELLYCGLNTDNWDRYSNKGFDEYLPLIFEMNNAYFTRDPGFVVGDRFFVSNMTKMIRKRESRILDFVLKRHPWFKEAKCHSFCGDEAFRIEGGDVCAIAPGKIAIGHSERTNLEAIRNLAEHLICSKTHDEVYVVPIPPVRAFMHLDTVFSMVASDVAVFHPLALNRIGEYFVLKPSASGNGALTEEYNQRPFTDHLRDLGCHLVQTGGGQLGAANVEQFRDATNCFAVDERKVIAYASNGLTNAALKEQGIEVVEVAGADLVKGRGGPRCMTMPISRWDV